MVSYLETGSDSPIGSDWDRGRDTFFQPKLGWSLWGSLG